MKPRVFISSTYYDLKYIRANLESFIDDFGFESVLFESGDITFEHGKALDDSCYDEVKNCQMMILLIGGRYGSKSTEIEIGDINHYENYYVSITKKEYLTARDMGMPIYVFIEKSVFAEYATFRENSKLYYSLVNNEEKLKFAHVDHVNVFEFISDIYQRGLAIYQFEKFEDIKAQLKSQFSGLFYIYLKTLQDKKETERVFNTIDELKIITDRMNQMMQKVGEKIFENQKDEYLVILDNQMDITVKHLAVKSATYINIQNGILEKSEWRRIASTIINDFLELQYNEMKNNNINEIRKIKNLQIIHDNINQSIHEILKVSKLSPVLNNIDYYKLGSLYINEIRVIINDNPTLRELYEKYLAEELEGMCCPF